MEHPSLRLWTVSRGPWRATISAYDCAYSSQPSGGTLVLLWHELAGAVVAAGPLEGDAVEPHNTQGDAARTYETPTPGVELVDGDRVLRTTAFARPLVTVEDHADRSVVHVAGRLVDADQRGPDDEIAPCGLTYTFGSGAVTIAASTPQSVAERAPTLVVPVVADPRAPVDVRDGVVVIGVSEGVGAHVEVEARPAGAVGAPERSFAVVPGFGTVRVPVDLASAGGSAEVEIRVRER